MKMRTKVLAITGILLTVIGLLMLLAVKWHLANSHYWEPEPWWRTHEMRGLYVFLLFAGGPVTMIASMLDLLIYKVRDRKQIKLH